MKTIFQFNARRFFSASPAALVGRLLCVFSVLALLISTPFSVRAANVAFGFTNKVFNVVDTNTFKVMDCGPNNPVQVDGTVLTMGRTRSITPYSDGKTTNSLAAGYFLVTNAYLGKGFVIEVPDDNGPTVYNATDLMTSGLNVFISKTVTNTGVAFNTITNALGFLPATSTGLSTLDTREASDVLALTNLVKTFGTNGTNLALQIGTDGTNNATAVSNGVVAYANNVGSAATNKANAVGAAVTNLVLTLSTNATNYANGVGAATTNLVLTLSTNATNYANAVGLASSNLASANLLFSTNYAATNTAAQILSLTLGNTNGLPSIYTTNNLGMTNGGSAGVNGTYIWSGSAYTNISSSTYAVTNTGGSWYVYSNGVAIYSSSTPAGGWSVVSGATPAPTSAYGRYVQSDGVVFRGYVASTNLTDQINTKANANGTATSNYVNSSVATVGLNATNNDTVVSNGVTAYVNSQVTAGSNYTAAVSNSLNTKINSNGTATSNFVTTSVTGLLLAQDGTATNLTAKVGSAGNAQTWVDSSGSVLGRMTSNGLILIVGTAFTNSGTSQFNGASTFSGVSTFGGDATYNGSATFNGGVFFPAIAGSQTGLVMMNPDGSLDSTYFTPADGSNLTNLNATQLLSGTVPDARLSANVPLINAQNAFTGNSNSFKGVGISSNLTVAGTNRAGYFIGNGGGLTNVNPSSIVGLVQTTNGGSTNQFLTNATAIGGFTNRGDTWLTNLASATQPSMLYVTTAGKVQALAFNGDTTYFVDGTGQLSHSVDVSMLPLRLKILETNNGSALTNLNASALALGTVPTSRAPQFLLATNGPGRSNSFDTPFVAGPFGAASYLHFTNVSGTITDLTLRHGGDGVLYVESYNGIGTGVGSLSAQYDITAAGGTGHGFHGNGEYMTNISGLNIQAGTINSNMLDSDTRSLLGGGGGGGATNAVSSINGLSNMVTLTFTNVAAVGSNGIAGIVVSSQNIIISNRYDSTSGTAITNAVVALAATQGAALTNFITNSDAVMGAVITNTFAQLGIVNTFLASNHFNTNVVVDGTNTANWFSGNSAVITSLTTGSNYVSGDQRLDGALWFGTSGKEILASAYGVRIFPAADIDTVNRLALLNFSDGYTIKTAEVGEPGEGSMSVKSGTVGMTLDAGTVTATTNMVVSNNLTVASLTASTVVYADSNKKLTSLANSAGVLTNDGSGNFSWVAVSGGSSSGGGSSTITSTNVADISASITPEVFYTNGSMASLIYIMFQQDDQSSDASFQIIKKSTSGVQTVYPRNDVSYHTGDAPTASGTLNVSFFLGAGESFTVTNAVDYVNILALKEDFQALSGIATNSFTTLTDGATISTDATGKGDRPHFRVTLGGNRTLANPTGTYDGQEIIWRVVQGTGTNTLTPGNAFVFGSDVTTNSSGTFPLSTTAGKADYIKGVVISNKVEIVGITHGY